MKKYIITGGKELSGSLDVLGSKNVATKLIVAASLTSDEVVLHNVPQISDVSIMLDIVKKIGGTVKIDNHTIRVQYKDITDTTIPLELGGKVRPSSMFIAPLLARCKKAAVPNPGGCRIGARPIDRHIEGLQKMGATIHYSSDDGYFYGTTSGLVGADYTFEKNSHTGTETLIIAAACANGKSVIHNAAAEPEIDDLINLLNAMGAKIVRVDSKTISIEGVETLHGAEYSIMPDRNEVVTLAITSALTGGKLWINNVQKEHISEFITNYQKAGGLMEEKDGKVRFYIGESIKPVDVLTQPHPGFMTDWQGPWAIFMTQAEGESVLHEAVYEYRFGYVDQLIKMGAKINFFNPHVENPESFYNFNYNEETKDYQHAIKIQGKTPLHNAILSITDLRAGATLVIAALIAKGRSVIYGVEQLERGYEDFQTRLKMLGADIEMLEE